MGVRQGIYASLLALCGVPALVGMVLAGAARAETDAGISALNARVIELHNAGRYGEAIPFAEKYAAAIKTRHGDQAPEYATAINNLAKFLQATSRLAEAETLYRRALAIYEKASGADAPNVAIAANNLALLLQATDRLAEAESLYRRALAIDERTFGPEHPQVALKLNNLAQVLQATKRFAEAEPLYRRALAVGERTLGPEHPDVAVYLDHLGNFYHARSRFAEAEPLYRRALAIDERSYGAAHPRLANRLHNLAVLLQDMNRLDEAEPLYRRALAIDESSYGAEHPNVAVRLDNLAQMLETGQRFAEAEPVTRRALAIDEKSFGPENPQVAVRLNTLARLLQTTNRLAEAELLYRRALAIDERSLGPEHPTVAARFNNLAALLQATNRLAEAEALYRRALAIDERTLGPEHPDVARDLNNLASLLRVTSRLAEAEPLLRRAVAVFEKALGADHPNVAAGINNLAELLSATSRLAEAEPLHRRALAIDERNFGPEHPSVAIRLSSLAQVLQATDRLAEAESLYRRALAIDESGLGPDHPKVAIRLNNLAILLQATERPDEADPLYRRALAIDEKSLGAAHPNVATYLNNLAILRAEQGDWAEAAALGRRAKPIMTAGGFAAAGGRADLDKAILARSTAGLRVAARAVYRAGAEDPAARAEGFELAQWAVQTGAADALAQMSVRFAKGAGPLAALVRERQDLAARREVKDRRLLAAVGAGDADLAAALRTGLARIDADLAGVDARLAGDFPEYAALAAPRPLSLTDAQAHLAEDEALLVFLDARVLQYSSLPEETLVWAVTRTDVRWTSVPLGTAALREVVERLRCGLDSGAWTDPAHWPEDTGAIKSQKLAQQARRDGCKRLLGMDVSDSEPPPFDLATAHSLYEALLAPIAEAIRGRRLLIAASGPLARLPFGVLVREPPKVRIGRTAQDFAGVAWLAASNALTLLPSVASLAALRTLAKESPSAPEPFLGVGNPLLDGNPSESGHVAAARAARARQRCLTATPGPEGRTMPALAHVPVVGVLFRGGIADAADIRRQAPLPETADELCAIAATLGAPEDAVLLGAEATETAVKALSESGGLAKARVVQFATHGFLAGESEAFLKAGAEPGLILTPPAAPSEADDGMLAASEVAQLRLNADWVVLSACNTAGGGASDTEALSGLARAFFYAGAKALLVTHWAVDSDAAVRLTTQAFAALRADPGIGQAEAFRRSVVAMMGVTRPRSWTPAAHPAVWAPFVLVGGGSG